MDDPELITCAASVLHPHAAKGRLFGDVGAAILSASGHVYTGVSVDTPSWGLCAERSAMAAMITAGEYKIGKVVAVWKDEHSGKLHILPPCGVCREFIRSVDESNLEAQVILGRGKAIKLRELLPLHEWPEALES